MNLLMYIKLNMKKYYNHILVDAVVVGVESHEEVQSYLLIYPEKDLVVKDCLRTTQEKVKMCNIVQPFSQVIIFMISQMGHY